ncbi:MAG: hypothetical protein HOP33_09125 [Verrucomicrobia bacterium]|nr:hypothetical protein [Verrucomicrobiota bacterium]
MKRGRPTNPLVTIRNWIEDARKEIRCAGCRHVQRSPRFQNPNIKFPGIGKDAEALGVHRIHLYLVLTGARTSHRLLARYNQLKEAA